MIPANSYRFFAVSIIALFFSNGVLTAATLDHGALDKVSSVSISLSLIVLPMIQIDTVSEVRLNITDRSVDSNYTESVCVKGNAGDKYSVTASGSSSQSGSFFLQSTTGSLLYYHVSFQDGNAAFSDELVAGTPSSNYDLPSLGTNCSGVSSALTVSFKSPDLLNVEPGLYTGHLTLVVSPL